MSFSGSTSFDCFDGTTQFPAVVKLCLRWNAARRTGGLPFYEDVALGSLGAAADHLALVEPSGDGG